MKNMRDVWIAADCIVSPLGVTTHENYQNIKAGKSGISLVKKSALSSEQVYAGWIDDKDLDFKASSDFTRFESISILSIKNALSQIKLDASTHNTVFILSTTKGNIELVDQVGYDKKRIHLHETAKFIAAAFGKKQSPLVVSNACISGVMAIIVAKRLIQSGIYDHAIITGADVLSKFVLSGFKSLNAISPEPCKPFDAKRKGVTLGEAAATIVLTANPLSIQAQNKIKITGGGLSNDANHISGPSRTGQELSMAVNHALAEAGVLNNDVDVISAHGTATLYNDEMEAKAFNLSGLANAPLNSLKGYFGHTLGAAGIVETIISAQSLMNDELIPTFGFSELGVSEAVNVIDHFESRKINTYLKTASGFGGCNAAIVLNKSH
jgi:3-oxoacyl-[acyl-carrier-protein] synthase I